MLDQGTPDARHGALAEKWSSRQVAIRNDQQPSDKNNIAPRFGFTYDPGANGEQVIRGGSGLFFGRAPYVLYGNTLSNTGLTQLDLNCQGNVAAPQPTLAAYAQDPSTIPTTCVGGGAVARVEDGGERFRTDDEDRLIRSGMYKP